MSYDALADTLDAHQTELSRAIAADGLTWGFRAYQDLTVETLAPMIAQTLTMIARYVRSGNPDEYKRYIGQLVRERMDQNRNTDDVLALSAIMDERIRELIRREWPGDANEAQRDRYIRRIDSMSGFARVAFNMAKVVHQHDKKA